MAWHLNVVQISIKIVKIKIKIKLPILHWQQCLSVPDEVRRSVFREGLDFIGCLLSALENRIGKGLVEGIRGDRETPMVRGLQLVRAP